MASRSDQNQSAGMQWHLPFGILMMLLFAVEYSQSRSHQSINSGSKPDANNSSGFLPGGCVVEPAPTVMPTDSSSSSGSSTNSDPGIGPRSTEIASVFAGVVPASMVESLKMEAGSGAEGAQFNLKDLFQSGHGVLTQPEPAWLKAFLEKTKDLLNENPDVKLVLIGMSESSEWFADRYKTDWELGSARAAALGARLKKMGVEEARLDIRAVGSRLGESTQVRVLLR